MYNTKLCYTITTREDSAIVLTLMLSQQPSMKRLIRGQSFTQVFSAKHVVADKVTQVFSAKHVVADKDAGMQQEAGRQPHS